MSRRDLAMADRLLRPFWWHWVLLGRLLPVIRTFIALPARIARLPQIRFQIYTFIGSWPWCFVLAYIGFKLGAR